jgi:hypothetical protein
MPLTIPRGEDLPFFEIDAPMAPAFCHALDGGRGFPVGAVAVDECNAVSHPLALFGFVIERQPLAPDRILSAIPPCLRCDRRTRSLWPPLAA